jgi:hypothetical protein
MTLLQRTNQRQVLRNLALAFAAMVMAYVVPLFFRWVQYLDGKLSPSRIEIPTLVFWPIAFSISTAVFAALQIARHPMLSKSAAEWVIAAGWDGKRPIAAMDTQLTWLECLVVVAFGIVECIATGGLSIFCVLSWLGVRTVMIADSVYRNDQQLAVFFVILLWLSSLVVLWFLPALVVGLAVLITVCLEQGLRRASAKWAPRAMLVDSAELPRFKKKNSEARWNLLGWHLRPEIGTKDPRPNRITTVSLVVLTSVWSFAICYLPGQVLGQLFKVDVEVIRPYLERISVVCAALPVAGVFLMRLAWFNPFRWYPSPGIRSRIAQRRLIVWSYDQFWLLLLAVILMAGASLMLDLWFPAQVSLSCGLAVLLLIRLCPNPVQWQLTSAASLVTVWEGDVRNTNRRQR